MSSVRNQIPIPSFSIHAVPVAPEDNEVVEAVGIPVENEERINVSINSQWIRRLESALQLWFSETKSDRIGYKEFSKLVPRVLSNLPASPSATPPEGKEEALLDFSNEERLWHDLYCVGVPTLYKIFRSESTLGWELVPVDGNRFKEMRRLLDEANSKGVLKKQSDEAKDLINSLRQMSAEKPSKVSKTDQESKDVSLPNNALLETNKNMTVEDRVRAKAQQREKILEEMEKTRDGPNTEDRIALADALFSHARHILRRRKRMQKGAMANTEPTKCVSTFRDIATALPKFSRNHITKLLQGIVETCPGWITWVDPKSGENGVPISKDATVWIETSGYKRIRAQLNGENVDESAPADTQKRLLPPQKTPETSITTVPVVTVSGAKRNLENDNEDRPEPKSLKPMTASDFQPKSLKSLTASVVKTAALVQQSNAVRTSTTAPFQQAQTSASETNQNNKRPPDEQGNMEKPPKKKRTALRINPNFILCDADYDGGGILQPSLELPRGLRKLFLQANAGERV